jgi:hypothetical protein
VSHLTVVLAFKDYTAIGAETKYTQDIAINLLNKYIFPTTAYLAEVNDIENPSRVVEDATRIRQIQAVKQGLISWLFSHEDDAEQYIPNFNEQQFDTINRDAFNSILDMSIQDFLRGVEGTTVEALTQNIDNLDVGPASAEKFKAIAEAVKDGKFFNTNITLRDIKNKTGESEQFYKLTPTTIDDPLFQQYLELTSDEEYTTAGLKREGFIEGYLNTNKMLEMARRWAHVISPREFTKILNGVESNTSDEELEEYRRQGVDIKWEGLNTPEDIIALIERGDIENTPWQIILANILARSIVDKSTPNHISYNYELFYPLSVFDEFSKMDKLLDDIKSESLDKLEKFMDKEGFDFSFDIKDFKGDLTFNNNFSDGDDLNKFLNVCDVIEQVNEYSNKNIKGLNQVNKLASEIASDIIENLSGGKIILTEGTVKQVDVELDGKNLPLRILEGTNPISRNDMEDLLVESESTKNTIGVLDGTDSPKVAEAFEKLADYRLTEKGPKKGQGLKFTSTPDKDTVELSIGINLDLSKKSPIPDAAKSITRKRKPITQKFNHELSLQKYAQTDNEVEIQELTEEQKLVSVAEKALEGLKNFKSMQKILLIVKGKDAKKVLRQTEIQSTINNLNAVIGGGSDKLNEQYSQRLSDIKEIVEQDDIEYDTLMETMEPLFELITEITDQLEPEDDLLDDISGMSDEEFEEWKKVNAENLQGLEEEEESDEEEGVVVDDTLSAEMYADLTREIQNPDDIGTIAHLRKISSIDNIGDEITELLDSLNKFGRSEDNMNAITRLRNTEKYTKNPEYIIRSNLQQMGLIDEEASISLVNGLIRNVKNAISKLKKLKGIEGTIGIAMETIKNYDIRKMVIDIITRSTGFNTVDIVDLSGKIKLTFEFNKTYGSQQRFGSKLKSFAELSYSTKKRTESTSGKVDFTVAPLYGRNYKIRSILTEQDTARVSDKNTRKGEIYDFFKVRIYNELYSNINELDRLLKRVEAE